MSTDDRHFSPAETARRLGVSAKALRHYEVRDLVHPVRSRNGWRAYGPREMARLLQIIALKRLGFSLARIGELLSENGDRLGVVLELQEVALAAESQRVTHALALVRSARRKLKDGQSLSIDDLATLTKETIMTSKPTPDEMKKIFDPFVRKHFSASEITETAKQEFDQEKVSQEWDRIIAEAKRLMAIGDPASAEALALARRWKAQLEGFTRGDPAVTARVQAVWNDAMADPHAAPKLPLNPEIFDFMGKVQAKLKELGE